jgi:hypothetical protein
MWPVRQRPRNVGSHRTALITGKLTGNFADSGPLRQFSHLIVKLIQWLPDKFPTQRNREFSNAYQGKFFNEQGFFQGNVSVHCLHACFAPAERDLFSLAFLQSEEEQMADGERSRERYGEAFWRAHHEAWRQAI